MADPSPRGSLVDVPGLEIGQYTLSSRLSGCSVVLARWAPWQRWTCAALPPAPAKPTCSITDCP